MKKQWRINRSSFPTPIKPLKSELIRIVFSRQQLEYENMAEALEAIVLNPELRPNGMSFVATRYQGRNHETTFCKCQAGFLVVQVTINTKDWKLAGMMIGSVNIIPYSLFSYGLLGKIIFTHGEKLNIVFLHTKVNGLIQNLFFL